MTTLLFLPLLTLQEYKTRRRPCALCRHIFPLKNMPTTVTLKSVWNKRNEFPEHVEMSVNLKGRWDKLYGEVHVCGFCAQFFEPKVRSMEQQREYEMQELQKRQDLLRLSSHKSANVDQENTLDERDSTEGVISANKWKQRILAHERNVHKIRENRRKKLEIRNRSIFKRPTGFGSSNLQRPKSLWGHLVSDESDSKLGGSAVDRHLPRRPASAAPRESSASHGRRSSVRVLIPSSEMVSRFSSKVPARRPQSAASRLRRRSGPKSGFGSSSTRIIPYRGHNESDKTTRQHRALRIDPVQQAKEMRAEIEKRTNPSPRSNSVEERGPLRRRPQSAIRRRRPSTATTGQRSKKIRRPASAGPRRRSRQETKRAQISGSSGVRSSRRPKSAAADWRRRRRRVPRPEWKSLL